MRVCFNLYINIYVFVQKNTHAYTFFIDVHFENTHQYLCVCVCVRVCLGSSSAVECNKIKEEAQKDPRFVSLPCQGKYKKLKNCMFVCIFVYEYILTHTHTHTYTHTHIYMCVYVYECVCVPGVCVCVCVYLAYNFTETL